MGSLHRQNDIETANNRSGDFDDGSAYPFGITRTKHAATEALRRWRLAFLVINASRRFCNTLDLKKEEEKTQTLRKIREHPDAIRAAYLFKNAAVPSMNETTKVAEEIEELPAMFVNSFKRRLVNENLLHRLNETLCSAVAMIKDEELRQPTEDRHLCLYDFMFKLRKLLDTIGDGHVTKLQCRELEEIISEIKEHLATFDDRQNHDAADPSALNFNLWEKKSCIGSGAYGIVHVGINRKTGTSCAIKEMLCNDDRYAQALHKEIKILSQLEHQNIVKYYGSKIVESQVSIYMEYVQPGSLKKYIASRGALQELVVRNFTAQILSGLAYLHSQRVVHRDIKPDNLLVDSQTNVKVADFGLAKHLAQSVGKHSVDGTFYYAAPEVIQKKAYKSSGEAYAADIWSLGCVVIEMFTGMHPWPDCSLPIQAAYKVCSKNQDPAIPENLLLAGKGFLKRCFAKNPTKRLSAADLLKHPFVTTKLSYSTSIEDQDHKLFYFL